jgi:hypothetical protein
MRCRSNQSIGRLLASSLTLVDRAGHERHALRLRWISRLRHDRDRGQRRHARLAHRDDVSPGSDRFEETDDMIDVLVQAEAAVRQAYVASVVPVGEVDVVLGQQRADSVAQQRREVARQRRDHEHSRLVDRDFFLEVQKCPERSDIRSVLMHRDLAAARRDAPDPERGSVMA